MVRCNFMMGCYFMVRCVVVWRYFMMGSYLMVGSYFMARPYIMVRPAVAIIVAVDIMAMHSLVAAPAVISASMAMIVVAMAAPAVTITPARPRAYAQEHAVVEVIRPVKALGRTAVGWGFVIAVRADGWFADFYSNLRAYLWRQGQARKQCYRAE
jgi:hypothetical protein